ncbi:MAG: glucosaminidase domain-containing protein [Bacteroidia bacterium]|nr:glucosaminidase domain-containing protein [Bacteroidia bacterium]
MQKLSMVFISILLVSSSVFAGGEEDSVVKEKVLSNESLKAKYVEDFKSLAVEEMHRSGIPASITLAQGLFESGFGTSRLAKEASNHFGIKCKALWTGPVIYEDDDALQECFRKYESALQSYKDHSDFLMNGQRYNFLFDLKKTDYKGWSRGLKKAGYATNPRYSDKLIEIIEEFSLYELDRIEPEQLALLKQVTIAEELSNTEIPIEKVESEEEIEIEELPNENEVKVKVQPVKVTVPTFEPGDLIEYNGLDAVVATYADSYLKLAHRHKLTLWKFYDYNDLNRSSRIIEGDVLYLEVKRNKSKTKELHIVQPGENMYEISQLNGIKLTSLYKMNRMRLGSQPAVGERLALQKTISKNDIVNIRSLSPDNSGVVENRVVTDKPSYQEKKEHRELISKYRLHTVKGGDTLYSISSMYGILISDVKKLNEMDFNYIKEGQVLKVGEKNK